jgi:hypothetical protein
MRASRALRDVVRSPTKFRARIVVSRSAPVWGVGAPLRQVCLTPGVQLPATAAFPLSRECSLGAHTAVCRGFLAGQLQRLVSQQDVGPCCGLTVWRWGSRPVAPNHEGLPGCRGGHARSPAHPCQRCFVGSAEDLRVTNAQSSSTNAQPMRPALRATAVERAPGFRVATSCPGTARRGNVIRRAVG